MSKTILFLMSILSILCSCNRGLDFDFEVKKAKIEIIETKDVHSYILLAGYYENGKSYLETLPYDLIMSKNSDPIGNYSFYKNYIKICNSGKFDRLYIDKLDKPERDFLIYLLQKGALNENEYCLEELFHIYKEGIGVEKDLKKADSIKMLFPTNYFFGN